MQHINLETFANGAFTAQVNRAIEEVTKNIQDPNTDAGTARKITVTIAFKPNQERNFIATGVQTKTTLAPALGYDDDGVSQKTTIKSGIANKTDVIVPNPVKLRPYRTFAEIEQPQSSYVFRIQDSDRGPSFKLVEADGGLWKNATMKKIKDYLAYELAEELEKYHITIIA